jgi:cytochrome P450
VEQSIFISFPLPVLCARCFFTAEQLESLIGDLFAAGTETTATTIRWAIVYLLNNMDIQNKMRKEIDEVVGSGRHPTMSDKPNLPYCEAVSNGI